MSQKFHKHSPHKLLFYGFTQIIPTVCILKLNLLVAFAAATFSLALQAAPTTPDVDIQESREVESKPSPKTPKTNPDLETLSASPVPKPDMNPEDREERETYFYPHEESLTFRVGVNNDFGNPPDSEDENASAQMGFAYMFESKGRAHIETGFDLFPKREEFLIHVGLKVVNFYTEAFRPYYKLGAALKLDSGDKFSTPIKTENYFVFAGLGFEDVVSDPLSFRVDLELFYSLDNVLLLVSTGLSFGF